MEDYFKNKKWVNPKTGRKVGYKKALSLGIIDKRGQAVLGSQNSKSLPVLENIKKTAKTKEEQIEKKSNKQRYFIQVNKANLFTYFTFGLIYQVNLEKRQIVKNENRVMDVQNLNPDFLIISNGIVNDLISDQVLIEVILTEEEILKSQRVKDLLLFPYPLPISRIASLYVRNEEVSNNIKAIVKTYNDTYIPDSLLKVVTSKEKKHIIKEPQIEDFISNPEIEVLISSKEDFDRILGMLSFVKNADLYYLEQTNSFADYSADFFMLLGLLNRTFENIDTQRSNIRTQKLYSRIISNDFNGQSSGIVEAIITAIKENKLFDKELTQEIIYQKVDKNTNGSREIIKKAFDLLFDYRFKEALKMLEHDDKLWDYYLMAVLYKFNQKFGNDKVNIKSDISNVLRRRYSGIVLAVLGMYYGYSSLPKQEEIEIRDSVFKSLISTAHNIKFTLEMQIEKVSIESVYQYCFNKIISDSEFDYLPMPSNKQKKCITVPRQGEYTYHDQSFKVKDEIVRVYMRSRKVDNFILKIIEIYPDKICLSNFLMKYIYDFHREIVEIKGTASQPLDIYAKREFFIMQLDKGPVFDMQMLQYCIESDENEYKKMRGDEPQ